MNFLFALMHAQLNKLACASMHGKKKHIGPKCGSETMENLEGGIA